MDPSALPDDLAELDRRLTGRLRPAPAGRLRQRVLAAVERELNRPRAGRAEAGFWRFAAVTAAGTLLCINFSMSVANDTDWLPSAAAGHGRIDTAVDRIRQLAPELPEREAYRQALLLRAGSETMPAPGPSLSADRIRRQRQREQSALP